MIDTASGPDRDQCTVVIVIEVPRDLHPLLTTEEEVPTTASESLNSEVPRAVDELLVTLGIPGTTVLDLQHRDPEPGDSRYLGLRINGARCRYSNGQWIGAYAITTGTLPSMDTSSDKVTQWLRDALTHAPATSPPEPATQFLTHLVQEAIRRQPALLLGRSQLEAYRSALERWLEARGRSVEWLPDAGQLHEILRPVVAAGISLADHSRVVDTLSRNVEKGAAPDDVAEALISELRPQNVEIVIPSAYLKEITLGGPPEDREVFAHLREALLLETGLAFPDFRFVSSEGDPSRTFSFRINHLETLPQVGLREYERLVDGASDHARSAVNPANHTACSVVLADEPGNSEEAGGPTWTPLGYLVLHLSVALRERLGAFVHQTDVEAWLTDLESDFPEPVQALKERYSIPLVTRVLRQLASESISIRNLRRIVEAMLDFDYVVCEPGRLIVLDPRLPAGRPPTPAWLQDAANIAAFVRTDLKRAISHAHTRGQASLTAFLLDPEAERILADGGGDENWQDAFLRAVRHEVDSLPSSPRLPAILTTVEACHNLRTLLAPEFPRLPVLAYQELAQELTIQPIARIELGDRIQLAEP